MDTEFVKGWVNGNTYEIFIVQQFPDVEVTHSEN